MIVARRAAASADVTPDDPRDRRKRDLEAVAEAARDCLDVEVGATDRVASYLLRTLRRGGRRPVTSAGAYAREAFGREPLRWRSIAIQAADGFGWVGDEEGDDSLSAGGPGASGEFFEDDPAVRREADGRLVLWDLRDGDTDDEAVA